MISTRPYGNSGMQLSALGLGAGQLGDARLSDGDAAELLAASVDAGVTLIDTAPSYGLSEQRIGRHLSTRRAEVVISSKLGYGVDGIPDWTGPCITAGVDQALRILRTDYLDIAHLHSCPWTVLAQGDVVDALERVKQAGKVRAIAYSGENEDLDYAVGMNRFDGFMASLNLFDQGVVGRVLPRIQDKGFIAKRPSANHPWRFDAQPVGDYCEPYWQRWQAMGLDNGGIEWGELAIRFALSIPGVSSAIVGTARTAHLRQNLDWAMKGPLDPGTAERWRKRFADCDQGWSGQI